MWKLRRGVIPVLPLSNLSTVVSTKVEGELEGVAGNLPQPLLGKEGDRKVFSTGFTTDPWLLVHRRRIRNPLPDTDGLSPLKRGTFGSATKKRPRLESHVARLREPTSLESDSGNDVL